MARVSHIEMITMDRNTVHGPVSCTCTVFKDEAGDQYLQLDTYGSKNRQTPGKKNQSIQFDEQGIRALRSVISNLR